MADRGWKRAERMLARDVGTERIPVTGERHGADFRSGPVAYQLKVRGGLRAWLFTWLDGICSAGASRSQIGALVLNRPRRPRRDALVIVHWSDWCRLLREPPIDAPDAFADAGQEI
jgi:hypothetical protein